MKLYVFFFRWTLNGNFFIIKEQTFLKPYLRLIRNILFNWQFISIILNFWNNRSSVISPDGKKLFHMHTKTVIRSLPTEHESLRFWECKESFSGLTSFSNPSINVARSPASSISVARSPASSAQILHCQSQLSCHCWPYCFSQWFSSISFMHWC